VFYRVARPSLDSSEIVALKAPFFVLSNEERISWQLKDSIDRKEVFSEQGIACKKSPVSFKVSTVIVWRDRRAGNA
jgi:hypothetical protein